MKRKYLISITVGLLLLMSACSGKDVEGKNIYTGIVEGDHYTISAQISGQVSEIKSSQGSTVKEGDILMSIDVEMYKLQKKQAMGALKVVKAKQEALTSRASEHLEKEALGAVEQAQASVDLVQLQIDKGNIKSSITGTITEIFVHKGEYIVLGTRVIEISDLNNLYVKIYVEESKRDKIKLDDKLVMTVNNEEFVGKVIYISPKSEFTPKNVETKDEKAKTLFEVKLQLPQNARSSIGSMVDITFE